MTSEQAEAVIEQLDTLIVLSQLVLYGVGLLAGLEWFKILREASSWGTFWGGRS